MRFLECLWVEGEARFNFDILIAIEIRRLRLDDIIFEWPCLLLFFCLLLH